MREAYLRNMALMFSLIVGSTCGLTGQGVFAADQPASAPAAGGGESSTDEPSGSDGGGRRGEHHPVGKACHDDVKKLCAGVKPGEGRIAQCLKQHAQELSPGCAEQLQSRAKRK